MSISVGTALQTRGENNEHSNGNNANIVQSSFMKKVWLGICERIQKTESDETVFKGGRVGVAAAGLIGNITSPSRAFWARNLPP